MVNTIDEQTNLWQQLSTQSTKYLARIPDGSAQLDTTSNTTQQISSAPIAGTFEHLKPKDLEAEASPEDFEIYKESFKIWFEQVFAQKAVDENKRFLKSSIFATINKSWQMTLNTNPNINNSTMDEIFQMIDRECHQTYISQKGRVHIQNDGETRGA